VISRIDSDRPDDGRNDRCSRNVHRETFTTPNRHDIYENRKTITYRTVYFFFFTVYRNIQKSNTAINTYRKQAKAFFRIRLRSFNVSLNDSPCCCSHHGDLRKFDSKRRRWRLCRYRLVVSILLFNFVNRTLTVKSLK